MLLTARERALRALRDFHFEQLREEEFKKEDERKKQKKEALESSKVLDVPKVKVEETVKSQLLACPNCEKEFKSVAGLSSHARAKKCIKSK